MLLPGDTPPQQQYKETVLEVIQLRAMKLGDNACWPALNLQPELSHHRMSL